MNRSIDAGSDFAAMVILLQVVTHLAVTCVHRFLICRTRGAAIKEIQSHDAARHA
ncbi:MAG: hypothetical protein HZB43_07930 [candidate division Zixibacteria bacterium]|nr:hypothetical protein [candidate division Zixibacteria bacterium]